MADMWPEGVGDLFGEAQSDWESFDGGGESFDMESEDGESSATRRRRQRELALRHQRKAQQAKAARARAARGELVPARSGGGAPAAKAAADAIRQLDLDSKVQADAFRSALAARDKQLGQLQTALVATVLAGQVKASFSDVFKNVFANAAVSAAPLAFMPERRGTGVTALATNKLVVAGVVAGLAFFGEQRAKGAVARKVSITSVSDLAVDQSQVFLADVLDDRGVVIAGKAAVWESSDTSVATVDATGKVTAHKAGSVVITAKADNVVDHVLLRVQ